MNHWSCACKMLCADRT